MYQKADKAVVERYVYGEARGDYIALDRTVRHARERRPPRQPRLPATYRGLFPAEIQPFEPPAPAVRAVYDAEGPGVIWPLQDGKQAAGTGRFMIDCTDASGFSAFMMGCLPGRDHVQLGELTWRAKVSVETTHVPMGVYSTYTVYYSQEGTITILGKTNNFPMEVKFWIDPTLGTWVRRHIYLGEDFILSQALRPESEW